MNTHSLICSSASQNTKKIGIVSSTPNCTLLNSSSQSESKSSGTDAEYIPHESTSQDETDISEENLSSIKREIDITLTHNQNENDKKNNRLF